GDPCSIVRLERRRTPEVHALDHRFPPRDDEGRAFRSLREAANAVRARRTEVLGFFGLLAVAEIFYAVILVIAVVYNFVLGGWSPSRAVRRPRIGGHSAGRIE